MSRVDLSAPVFPGHAAKRARQAAAMEVVVDRIIQVVEAGPDIAGLLLVRDAALSVQDERFDLSAWRCGTTCCGVGWFCTFNPGDPLTLVPTGRNSRLYELRLNGLEPTRGLFQLVADRFRIKRWEAQYLFGPGGAEDPSGVAHKPTRNRPEFLSRLEQFIAAHSPTPYRRVDADAYDAGQIELERDERDHAENQPDPYDGGEAKDANWR